MKSELLKNKCSYQDYRKLWKALFYCKFSCYINIFLIFLALWQADKVRLQHELADNITKILDIFSNNYPELMFDWLKAGLNILSKEWNKIDYCRINKFMYLVNRLLKEIMKIFNDKKWTYKVKKNYL